MRYAVISDLHANRQAVKAVFDDIDQQDIDEIICLGDVFGYGPSPMPVFDLVKDKVKHFVLGNHDAVVAGYMKPEHFNDHARELIEWTCSVIDPATVEFFKDIPLLIHGDYYSFSHGEFVEPGRFGYIIDEDEAMASFACCQDRLMMIGHSHVPGLYVIGNSGTPHWLSPQNFGLEDEKRYIVNVGSVGQPRDNDVRASYCVFDDQTEDIYFHKVAFDIPGYRDDLAKNSLPAVSYFLTLEPSAPFVASDSSVITQPTDFVPLSEQQTIRMKKNVKNLQATVEKLQKAKTRLIVLLGIMFFSFVIFAVLFGIGIFTPDKKNDGVVYKSVLTQIQSNLQASKGDNLLTMPGLVEKVGSKSRLSEWTVKLSDPRSQKVAVIKNKDSQGENVFDVASEISEPVEIISLPVPAKKGMRFNARCQMKKGNFESGFVALVMQQQLPDGSWKNLLRKEPKNFESKNGWTVNTPSLTPTSALNKDGDVRILIRARIKGEVFIKECSLKRIQ